MPKTFKTITFGCKVNTYESESLKENLIRQGYIYTQEDKADIFIVNTCAVTQVAEKKAMEKLRSIQRNYPDSEIVVMGCFSQLHPEKIETIKNVKVLAGVDKRNNIPELIKDDKKENIVASNTRKLEYEDSTISSFNSEVRAFVKIQDGCDNFCSYCVIPLTRGKSRSRKKESILNEIRNLALNGYKEIVLTGIDMGSYNNGPSYLITDLVEDILNLDVKTFRLRISSLETSQVSDRLISIMASNPRLVPHMHLPLQSGAKRICQLMFRKYDLEGFYNLSLKLREKVKNIALSTDVIVGFPSETEEDFLESYNFIKKVNFMRLHVFPYSRRPLTKAYYMKDQVDRGVSKNRVRILNELSNQLALDYYNSFLNQELEVLIEEKLEQADKGTIYRGYTQNYIDVKVISNEDIYNNILKVKIENKPVLDKYTIIQ